jgi:hypothetical protein
MTKTLRPFLSAPEDELPPEEDDEPPPPEDEHAAITDEATRSTSGAQSALLTRCLIVESFQSTAADDDGTVR